MAAVDTLLEQCMADYAGVECYTRTLGLHESDLDISEVAFPNWVFVREGYLTYGEEEADTVTRTPLMSFNRISVAFFA